MSNTVKLPTCPKCGAPIPPAAPQGLCPKCVLVGAAMATEHGAPATATSEIPSIERIATAFPQLEILELIGRGGMGFVFKARQPHLDRFVALKLLPDKLAKDAQFAERFNREGRVLAKLNHPNIVSVFDFGQTGGFYYLLMEYVDGVNLRQAMRAGRFSPGEALSIVPKVCEALQYAHEQGILHRDIKPENILLDAKGRVKIADFGIAKLVGEDQPNVTLTNTGAALGTPHYMAPEQLEKPSTVDHRADIYSLGVVFYEMLTGELPIGRFAPPSSKTPVNTTVDDVVFRTLEKDRERRYQSAGEMKTQVEHLTESGCTPAGQASLGSAAITPEASAVRRPAQALVGVGIFNWAGSIIVMMVLAYAGLGRQFPLSPQELGSIALLMILFSSVILLAGLKMMKLQTYPLVVLGSLLAMVTTPGNIIGLPVGLWALVTLRQPKVRAAFKQPSGAPGFSIGAPAAIFAVVLVCGIGLVLPQFGKKKPVIAPPGSVAITDPAQPAIESAPKIQFTFTTIDLREEEGARWLAMDFVQQIRGECQRTFRYDANVPGFTPQSRTTAFMTDAKAGFAPVLHQRVSWKLPPSLPQGEAEALRELVARERIGKPIILEPGEEYPLFKIVVPGGGSLVTAVGVKLTAEGASPKAGRTASPQIKPAINPTATPVPAVPTPIRIMDFTPETEVTLTGLFSAGGQLALDREKQVSLPPEGKGWDRTKLLRWLADEGVDLAVIDYNDEEYGWGLAMRPTTSHIDSPWQIIGVEDLKHSLANPVMHLEKMDAAENRMNLYRLYPRAVPLSFAIRTGGGRMAALQIIGFSENPHGVKIRYKLVQARDAYSALEIKMVIDAQPAPAGAPPSTTPYWTFKSLIPRYHEAQILFVRWTNDVPSVQEGQSGYFKVGARPAEVDFSLSHYRLEAPQSAHERSQWNVNVGLGFTVSAFSPEDPPYRRIDPPARTSVRAGRQGRIPLVEFVGVDGARCGIDLRILLRPLQSPAIRTLPAEKDHGHYISGRGLVATEGEARTALKEMPIDP